MANDPTLNAYWFEFKMGFLQINNELAKKYKIKIDKNILCEILG
jgi:hypothetical protein